MKILVLSDSHSALSFMRRAVDAIKPDAIIHLGDHYDDGETIAFAAINKDEQVRYFVCENRSCLPPMNQEEFLKHLGAERSVPEL